MADAPEVRDCVVIGAGQAGLSSAFHLRRLGIDHVVLDANARPGGAWQHRWPTLTMESVHGVAGLPDMDVPDSARDEPARDFVPRYFAAYEDAYDIDVTRPVSVRRVDNDGVDNDGVDDGGGILRVWADDAMWRARTIVNATGTWTQPFIPYYPGRETFVGEQFHTVDYRGAEAFRGKRTIVVGGGASAVQLLGEIALVTDTIWVTRTEPRWRSGPFTAELGRESVARVEDRVRKGLPPSSVVDVTGLQLRPEEREAERRGAYRRHPMFARIEPDGVRWASGAFEYADAILWATGFRPAVSHLALLNLRTPEGGIRLTGRGRVPTQAAADKRVQMVGYGPSASTIGANRAGRVAARGVADALAQIPDGSTVAARAD